MTVFEATGVAQIYDLSAITHHGKVYFDTRGNPPGGRAPAVATSPIGHCPPDHGKRGSHITSDHNSTVCISCGCTEMDPCEGENGPCEWLAVGEDEHLGVCTECPYALGVVGLFVERAHQVVEKGHTLEADDRHTDESLALAAACYAAPQALYRAKTREEGGQIIGGLVPAWPDSWPASLDKRGKVSRIRQLEIAGALIAAEIDRLSRIAACGLAKKGGDPE
jgi:hypothetical protein